VVTITDFGLACREPAPPKRLTSFCGTIDFLAPEMVRLLSSRDKTYKEIGYGKEVDIWAIGVISYALLCAELPFSESDDKEDPEVMRQILVGGVTFGRGWMNKSSYGIIQ
jgi:serine/threonine protein kinase